MENKRLHPHSGHRQRLRRLYCENGADRFLTHQLLELLLTFSIPRIDTNVLAHRLLGKEGFGSAKRLFEADVQELTRVPGVGEQTALMLSVVGELLRRTSLESAQAPILNTPNAVIRYCLALSKSAGGLTEGLHMISLDSAFGVLHTDRLYHTPHDDAAAYPRAAVELALKWGAEHVILICGVRREDPVPLKEDYENSRLIVAALEPIGIGLKDYFITNGTTAYSIAMDGRLTIEDDI